MFNQSLRMPLQRHVVMPVSSLCPEMTVLCLRKAVTLWLPLSFKNSESLSKLPDSFLVFSLFFLLHDATVWFSFLKRLSTQMGPVWKRLSCCTVIWMSWNFLGDITKQPPWIWEIRILAQNPFLLNRFFLRKNLRLETTNRYSCLENSMDRGAWRAPVSVVTRSWTRLSDWYLHLPKRWKGHGRMNATELFPKPWRPPSGLPRLNRTDGLCGQWCQMLLFEGWGSVFEMHPGMLQC